MILRALATDPADRWATCAQMAEALREIALQLGGPFAGGAIAELVALLPARGSPSAPAPHTAQLGSSLPRLRHRYNRCRRSLALGVVGGSLATALVAALATTAPREQAARDAETRAAPVRPPAASSEATGAAQPTAAPRGLLAVDAADVTRLAGPAPRSHSSSAFYSARLCIDADGSVLSAAVLDGPRRLHRRIARALRRWQYLPYRDDEGLHPVCFDIDSYVERISGCS